MPDRMQIQEMRFWSLTHRADSALPGYLILASKLPAAELSDLPDGALTEVSPLLAQAQRALRKALNPIRIYIGRYGHARGHSFHFHLIPICKWVETLFWCDDRYRLLQSLTEPGSDPGTDGAELTLFVWREFCERSTPPPIQGPSITALIALLREEFNRLPVAT